MAAAGSIFESFYLLFSSNADDVEEGANKAEKSGDKLEKKLKGVDGQAKKAGDSFGDLAKRAAAVILPFVGFAGLKNAVLDFAASADAAGKLAASVNMDVEALQMWQGAAERAGGTSDGFASSVKSLNGKLAEFSRTGGGEAGDVFWRLGIQARDANGKVKSSEAMLLSLAGRFEGLSKQKAIHFGSKLGLDEGTILLLQKGKAGVADLLARQKELGVYTKQDAEASRKFNNVKADSAQALNSLGMVVLRLLLPVFTDMTRGITNASLAVRKHKDLVTGFFVALCAILGVLAIKAGLAFAPFIAFAAVILAVGAGFAILYEDVQKFLKGHNSMIGKLSKDYPWIGELVLQIVDVLKTLWAIGKAVFAFLADAISSPTKALENFKATVGPLVDSLKEKFPELGQAIEDIGTIIGGLFEIAVKVFGAIFKFVWQFRDEILAVIKGIMGVLGKGVSWIASFFRKEKTEKEETPAPGSGAYGDDPDNPMTPGDDDEYTALAHARRAETPVPPVEDTVRAVSRGQGAIMQTDIPLAARPLGAAGAARPQEVHKTQTLTVGTVTVETQATDAAGVAAGLGSALGDELRGAMEHFDDGVAG